MAFIGSTMKDYYTDHQVPVVVNSDNITKMLPVDDDHTVIHMVDRDEVTVNSGIDGLMALMGECVKCG